MKPTATFFSPLVRCQYLPDRFWRLRYELTPEMRPDEYMDRLLKGWRRVGPIVFRPECPACRMCQSLRVPVESFRPDESQRRAWKKNVADVTLRIGEPSSSPEKLRVYAKFHSYGHETKGWPADHDPDIDLFLTNPFPTEEWTYYVGDRLVAVGYVDVLRDGLSAIYFYWDPAEAQRSLGTYNVLTIIAAARQRGLRNVYLGYYVEGCRSLEYKARFRPNEVLGQEGAWKSFRA